MKTRRAVNLSKVGKEPRDLVSSKVAMAESGSLGLSLITLLMMLLIVLSI